MKHRRQLSYLLNLLALMASATSFALVGIGTETELKSVRELLTVQQAQIKTLRASINLLFNPAQRVELGAELLWGERKNGDGSSGSASQLQFSARYLY